MSKDQTSASNIVENANAWLNNYGHPLEFYSAKSLRGAGLTAAQGFYIEDPESGKALEIDVLAFQDAVDEDAQHTHLAATVECKRLQEDRAWIFFESDRPSRKASIQLRATPASGIALAASVVLQEKSELDGVLLLRANVPHCFGGCEFKLKTPPRSDESDGDAVYRTLNSVTRRAVLYATWLDRSLPTEKFASVSMAFPLLVVDGTVLRAHYDPAQDRLLAEPATHLRLTWAGTPGTRAVGVDVVTKSALMSYAAEFLAPSFRTLRDVISDPARRVREALRGGAVPGDLVILGRKPGSPPVLRFLADRHEKRIVVL